MLGCVLVVLILILFGLILLYKYGDGEEKKCIYCGKPHTGWGAEHFLCGIRHPQWSIMGTVSHILSVIFKWVPPFSNSLIRVRNFAENKVKKIGERGKEK